jgi:hypothetical protein
VLEQAEGGFPARNFLGRMSGEADLLPPIDEGFLGQRGGDPKFAMGAEEVNFPPPGQKECATEILTGPAIVER